MLIGNHPHVIQKTRIENRKVVAYSLGSFNQSPSADYIIHDALPEYSMALHVYFSKDRDKGNVRMITFSILPVIIVYLILSKNIVSGLAVGAVKG